MEARYKEADISKTKNDGTVISSNRDGFKCYAKLKVLVVAWIAHYLHGDWDAS